MPFRSSRNSVCKLNGLKVYLSKISTGVPLTCQIRELLSGQTPTHYFQSPNALPARGSKVCQSNLTSTLEKEKTIINVYRYNNKETDDFFILTLGKENVNFAEGQHVWFFFFNLSDHG